ncbi:MAG TPA: aminotransferase class V-fold PLP-dependent enzyme [Gammaproteobacteria bacterium]|nr:aminotransferase class V-fold PLP-dependent enzyme [Gammaproteobacteria bacterium]
MLPSQRHLFDIPDDVAYLNCAYMAPLMRAACDAGERGIHCKRHPWLITSRDFFTESERIRTLFAQLVNADSEDVAIVPSASYGVAAAARNLPLRANQRALVLEEQFPSNVYAWKASCQSAGAELVAVKRPVNGDWTAAVLDALDERVAVAALPQCRWTDGALLDLERISAACRESGTALVLDLTQSLGAMPFDVTRIRPDFVVTAGYKWLLGPYSLGFLYVGAGHRHGEPLEHNWIARAGSEDFSALVAYRDDFQPGARRFDMGERANFHLLPMGIAALHQILEWGVDRIAQTLAVRTREIAERAASVGLDCLDERQRAGHFLGLGFPQGIPPGLAESLARRGVYVSVRGDTVRVTPHLYNTGEDVDRLLTALEALIQ